MSLKFKKQFRKWLWINIREKKAKQKYSPEKLSMLLDMLDVEDIDMDIIDKW
jgi:hypothetical protein